MNQRLTRKDIKRDEFVTVVGRGVEYAESHTRQLLMTIGSVLAALLVGILLYFYLDHRAQAANEALADAVKIYRAPVQAAGANPQDPKEPTFPTEVARQARARQLLTQVRDSYRFTDAADVAALYLAELDAGAGKLEAARKIWGDFVKKHGDNMLAAQARVDLMELDRGQGRGQQVTQGLREMLDQADAPLPQDVILFQLGTTLEQLSRDQEAVQSYQRLVDEYPQSPYRQSAQQRLTALDPTRAAASPQLGMGGPGGLPPS
jgi:hypothetical protein